MKKVLLMLTASFLALSCSDDDDNADVAVTGTWKLTRFEINRDIDLDNDGTASRDILAETGCFDNSNILFGGDGVAIVSMQAFGAELAGTGNGNFEYSINCNGEGPATMSYTISDNTVSLQAGTSPITLNRSGNKLTYSAPQPLTLPVEENGEITDIQVDTYVEYTKQ